SVRRRESADHQAQPPGTFDRLPCLAATALVRRVDSLADDPFDAELAGPIKHLHARADDVLTKSDASPAPALEPLTPLEPFTPLEPLTQRPLALNQRRMA